MNHKLFAVHTYAELNDYAHAFAAGKIGLLAVVGTPGLGKSQGFIHAMQRVSHYYAKGVVSAFMLYKDLFDYKDKPVFLDDCDTLYADNNCTPLLKTLTETTGKKTVAWGKASFKGEDSHYPRRFVTSSSVLIICNDLKIGEGVSDKGHCICFQPSVEELHRQVVADGWANKEAVKFMEDNLELVTQPSMRDYFKIGELRKAFPLNWKERARHLICGNLDADAMKIVADLERENISVNDKIKRFMDLTKLSRASYFNYKKILRDKHDKGSG